VRRQCAAARQKDAPAVARGAGARLVALLLAQESTVKQTLPARLCAAQPDVSRARGAVRWPARASAAARAVRVRRAL